MSDETFLDLVVAQRTRPEDIDDFVDAWHDAYEGPLELHAFLGMSEEEYGRWALDPKALADIVDAHRARMREGAVHGDFGR